MTEEFIPPDPHEPVPAQSGATDFGLDGALVTDPNEYTAPAFAASFVASASGAPTWSQVYNLAKSQVATYAKGRVRENVNDYTQWYYGDNTAAAFCFIFISWCLAHAAGNEAAGLALIGGKKAYVPYIRNVAGYHAGHSGMKPGAIVAVNSFNHIGFCTKVTSSTFNLLSGNSTSGSSDDAVTVKTYPLSYASGYVNLKYGSTAPKEDDDVPEYVSLGMKKAQAVKNGQTENAVFDVEYGDAGKAHADGPHPGIVGGGAKKTSFMLEADVTGSGSVRLVETDPKNKYKVTKTYPMKKVVSGEPVVWLGKIEPNQHLYLEFHPAADGTMNAAVKCLYWHL